MQSTFMGLEIGKRGLMSHQKALQVTGHNISNAENKEYSRQRVVITATDPIYDPSLSRAETAGQLGQGSEVAIVERIRDHFIDDRIVQVKNELGYWNSKDGFIKQIEYVLKEPTDESIRHRMDKFWTSWQELSNNPELRSTREPVKRRGMALAAQINHVYKQLDQLQKDANREVGIRVAEINVIARNIRDLNERILKSEAMGDHPNDLMDRRDALIENLSSMVDITVGRSDQDEVIVYIGSENLVQGEVLHELEAVADPANHGYYKVMWKGENNQVPIKRGQLAALIETRDVILRDNINQINSLAVNMTDLFNEVHRDGFGRNGSTNNDFFREIMISDNTEGNFDLNHDGIMKDVDDVTAIYKVAGNNKIDASAAIGITGTLTFVERENDDGSRDYVTINYNKTDSVNMVIKKINERKSGVVAYINHNGQLALKATVANDNDKKNFMIRYLEDSGQFLVGLTGVLKQSGNQGAFDYSRINEIKKLLPNRNQITITPKQNPAVYMAVSEAVQLDIDKIAAAQGKDIGGTGDFNKTNGIGDGNNALRIAHLRHKAAMIDNNSTFNDYYIAVVANVGTQGEEAKDRVRNQTTLKDNLEGLRKSVSGVSLDEEFSNLVAYQHGYTAAAKVITTFDKMLEIVIRMGA